MTCNRCNCGIFNSEDKVSLNKIWHRNCFTCYSCGVPLNKLSAKVFEEEVYCCNCCPLPSITTCDYYKYKPFQEMLCQSSSTPSCDIRDFLNDVSNICRPKNNPCIDETACKKVHSCSCLSTQCKNHCFCYPIPREVANYYNRTNTKPCCLNCPYVPRKKICFPEIEDNCPPCIRRIKCRPCNNPCQKCCTSCPPKKCDPCCLKSTCSPVEVCYVKPKCPPKDCCPTKKCHPSSYRNCCLPRDCCSSCPPRKCCPAKCNRRCSPPPIRSCPPVFCRNTCCNCCGKYPCTCKKYKNIMNICCACCNRCGCRVYITERMVVSCGVYHIGCFSCFCCRKQLNLSNVYENCGEIYCKQCYNDSFGIRYYGYNKI